MASIHTPAFIIWIQHHHMIFTQFYSTLSPLSSHYKRIWKSNLIIHPGKEHKKSNLFECVSKTQTCMHIRYKYGIRVLSLGTLSDIFLCDIQQKNPINFLLLLCCYYNKWRFICSRRYMQHTTIWYRVSVKGCKRLQNIVGLNYKNNKYTYITDPDYLVQLSMVNNFKRSKCRINLNCIG